MQGAYNNLIITGLFCQ